MVAHAHRSQPRLPGFIPPSNPGSNLACVQKRDGRTQITGLATLVQGGKESSPRRGPFSVPPLAWGLASAALLPALYLTVLTLAQSWSHARDQMGRDAPYLVAFSLGLGGQVGLFTHLRAEGRARPGGGAGAAIGASGGTSTLGMLACCAHHASDILPIFGLTAAAGFLSSWRPWFLAAGVASNAAGLAYLLFKFRAVRPDARARGPAGACPMPTRPSPAGQEEGDSP